VQAPGSSHGLNGLGHGAILQGCNAFRQRWLHCLQGIWKNVQPADYTLSPTADAKGHLNPKYITVKKTPPTE